MMHEHIVLAALGLNETVSSAVQPAPNNTFQTFTSLYTFALHGESLSTIKNNQYLNEKFKSTVYIGADIALRLAPVSVKGY
jgi:hypothetical protein